MLSKIERESARGILVVPFWLETPPTSRLRRMADEVRMLHPTDGAFFVSGARTGTDKCPLLLAEIGLKKALSGTRVPGRGGRRHRGSGAGCGGVANARAPQGGGEREGRQGGGAGVGSEGEIGAHLTDFTRSDGRAFVSGRELRALVSAANTRISPELSQEAQLGKALEPSSWNARARHMRAICMFLRERQRDFPLDECDLVAFMGYLYTSLVTKTGPQLRAVSVSGYISGIRLTHEALGLGALPTIRGSLRLSAAFEGYKKVSDLQLPPKAVRIAIPVHCIYEILSWARRDAATSEDRRDAALVITASVCGLRAAGVQSILFEHCRLDADHFQVFFGPLKGRTVEAALLLGGRSFYAPPSVQGHPHTVLQVVYAWTSARESVPGPLFSGIGLLRARLDPALRRLARAIGFTPPPGCAVSSHSARITAFSQMVLMRWSDVRLRFRFDWKNVQDMAVVYLDHRVRVVTASRVFFSPDLPEPVRTAWELLDSQAGCDDARHDVDLGLREPQTEDDAASEGSAVHEESGQNTPQRGSPEGGAAATARDDQPAPSIGTASAGADEHPAPSESPSGRRGPSASDTRRRVRRGAASPVPAASGTRPRATTGLLPRACPRARRPFSQPRAREALR